MTDHSIPIPDPSLMKLPIIAQITTPDGPALTFADGMNSQQREYSRIHLFIGPLQEGETRPFLHTLPADLMKMIAFDLCHRQFPSSITNVNWQYGPEHTALQFMQVLTIERFNNSPTLPHGILLQEGQSFYNTQGKITGQETRKASVSLPEFDLRSLMLMVLSYIQSWENATFTGRRSAQSVTVPRSLLNAFVSPS